MLSALPVSVGGVVQGEIEIPQSPSRSREANEDAKQLFRAYSNHDLELGVAGPVVMDELGCVQEGMIEVAEDQGNRRKRVYKRRNSRKGTNTCSPVTLSLDVDGHVCGESDAVHADAEGNIYAYQVTCQQGQSPVAKKKKEIHRRRRRSNSECSDQVLTCTSTGQLNVQAAADVIVADGSGVIAHSPVVLPMSPARSHHSNIHKKAVFKQNRAASGGYASPTVSHAQPLWQADEGGFICAAETDLWSFWLDPADARSAEKMPVGIC